MPVIFGIELVYWLIGGTALFASGSIAADKYGNAIKNSSQGVSQVLDKALPILVVGGLIYFFATKRKG